MKGIAMTRMQHALRMTMLLAALAPVALALTACNTTAGAGKDIAATGNTITKDADQSKP